MFDQGPAHRDLTVLLGGESLELRASPDVVIEVQALVADPLFITRELFLDQHAMQARQYGHQPQFQFTVTNIPQLLHIGAVAAGSALSLSEVDELVFRAGYCEAKERAIEFLCDLVGRCPAPIQAEARQATLPKLH